MRYTHVTTLAVLLGATLSAWPARATHIDGIPMEFFRTAMEGEGYLAHSPNPGIFGNRHGHEYTGWVDVRHPAEDGTTQTFNPFDRYNRYIDVRTITVTDTNGVAAAPQIQRDLNFSNKIYAQAGISMIRRENGAVTLDGTNGTPNVSWPINTGAEDDAMKMLSRSGQAKTINAWYVKQYGGSSPNGLTSPSSAYAGTGNDGSGIADQAVSSTFGHEIGHMVLNGTAQFNECAAGNGGASESCTVSNFMYKIGQQYTFNATGLTNGIVEDPQVDRLFLNGGANNPGYVQSRADDPNYGNKVDWDFVVDDFDLEDRANGADSHAGADFLYWEITTDALSGSSVVEDHDHTGLDAFADPGAFSGDGFLLIDVFSLSLRYGDFDRDGGNLDLKSGALDYAVDCRSSTGDIGSATAVKIFEFGWTATTDADNYLTRWKCPFQATGIWVFGKTDAGHDGNVQIDAVIASAPEPGAWLLLGSGGLASLIWRRRG